MTNQANKTPKSFFDRRLGRRRVDPRRTVDSASDSHERIVKEGLIDVLEASAFLGLSRTSLYDLMDRGELRYVKIGRSRRIPRIALVELAAKSMRGGFNPKE